MLTVLGLNFQKSNEKMSVSNLNIDYFNTEAKAASGENDGVKHIGYGCTCPWLWQAGCWCTYD